MPVRQRQARRTACTTAWKPEYPRGSSGDLNAARNLAGLARHSLPLRGSSLCGAAEMSRWNPYKTHTPQLTVPPREGPHPLARVNADTARRRLGTRTHASPERQT